MIEDLVPEQAPGLIAALSHVQNRVPPHYLHKKRSPQSISFSFIVLVRAVHHWGLNIMQEGPYIRGGKQGVAKHILARAEEALRDWARSDPTEGSPRL